MTSLTAEPLSRRRLLAVLALSSPILVAQRRRGLRAAQRLDRETLTALAEVVLPSAIGSAGVVAAADGFERWLTGYRGGAELLHGYGSSEVRFAPPSPAPRFEADLQALERGARDRHGRAFGQLAVGERRALVEAALASNAEASVSAPAASKHVAVALLSHWADSAAGFDAAYGARIGRLGCRPLAANPERPAQLGDPS